MKKTTAVRNARYFGFGKGVTFYSHTADVWVPFGKQQVISTNESEALYVIDALCHHESDLHIQEHYTDMGGSSDHVFALTALLGFKFAPWISSSLDRNLYPYQPVGDQGPLNALIASPVRAKYIIEHWEEMQRVASSIRHGPVSASLLMRRLRACSRQKMHRASSLYLIMAAIAAWNAVYLSKELKKQGEANSEEYLPHITPLGWEHINLIGQYNFTHQSGRSLDNLRPLRLPEQEEQPGRELTKAGTLEASEA